MNPPSNTRSNPVMADLTPETASLIERLSEPWERMDGAGARKVNRILKERKDAIAALTAWRPEVRAFADLMEAKLRANDHKPGWKGDDPEDLLIRLGEEGVELHDAVSRWRSQVNWQEAALHLPACRERIGREAADVANFAMMIADVCGAIDLSHTGAITEPARSEGEA